VIAGNGNEPGLDPYPSSRSPSRLGKVRHALFDFDGTLSVLRQGWEDVMIPVLSRRSAARPRAEIVQEVREYVDRSTGILTIQQMQWLAEAVQRHGLAPQVLTAREYKALYLSRLMVFVRQRIGRLETGQASPADFLISGAQSFVAGMVSHEVRLYLASGTDHEDMAREANALGLLPYFNGDVYGALDHNESHAKERVIQHILEENNLSGNELLIIGDGPVEIREGASRHALTLGVASDEIVRAGWNQRKVERLASAGADLIVADFSHAAELIAMLCEPRPVEDH
jgi:phosphoglycolate phosphatase-like HAD superfamily hydrolase